MLRMVCVVLRRHVYLRKSGAMGRFTAQMAAMSPSPAVGPEMNHRPASNGLKLSPSHSLTDVMQERCLWFLFFFLFFLSSVMLNHVAFPAGRICSLNNGGCSHVCADEAWGALCSCPVGYKLSPNGAICEGVCV